MPKTNTASVKLAVFISYFGIWFLVFGSSEMVISARYIRFRQE